jgi:hypothetical protein
LTGASGNRRCRQHDRHRCHGWLARHGDEEYPLN